MAEGSLVQNRLVRVAVFEQIKKPAATAYPVALWDALRTSTNCLDQQLEIEDVVEVAGSELHAGADRMHVGVAEAGQ